MYGAILGDIVGEPYEFRKAPWWKNFELFTANPTFTDDSVMTVAIAEALTKTYKKSDDKIRKAVIKSMHKWGAKYPDAGYGGGFWYWLNSSKDKPYNSFGNGSAMRASAAGWFAKDLEDAERLGMLTADVTHNHPEGIKGAQAVAAIIYLARTEKVKAGATPESVKAVIKDYIESRYEDYNVSRTCNEIRLTYHFNETCQGTVPEAICAFLEGKDYEDVIRTAVTLGGDCDTLTCIAGGMAEALYGMPDEFMLKVREIIDDEMVAVVDNAYKHALS